ncbi:MAG: hypothetical protein KJ706_03695 [Candidatus Omnitrophica bacterium]|nr:hypothetical protein [Candidatus Omnitrophota bacterium]MBU4590862.1 hypothetical protein [Candidatus Omnitrophota bacterium]
MMMFKKYFIIIPTVIIFFLAGEASALRVPVDPERTRERIEAKRLYDIVVEFMNIMRTELDLIDNTKFNEIKEDASLLRNSVQRMFKAGKAVYDLKGFSDASWPKNVIYSVRTLAEIDVISGGVYRAVC